MYAKWDKINVPFFSNLFEFKIYLFKIPNHFLRNPFLNFDKNLNPSCVMEGKKKEKNVSERVIKHLCSWWNNCTLEMIVWKGKEFEFKCYCVHTFLSAEDISLTGSHVFFFFQCSWFHIPPLYIYISNLKIHYGMASCRFDNLFFCLFLSIL